MSDKELQRAGVLARVKAEQLRLKDAAELMSLSYRQAKRLWKRYQTGRAAALKHGGPLNPITLISAGRPFSVSVNRT